jgi:hypothetical protein
MYAHWRQIEHTTTGIGVGGHVSGTRDSLQYVMRQIKNDARLLGPCIAIQNSLVGIRIGVGVVGDDGQEPAVEPMRMCADEYMILRGCARIR